MRNYILILITFFICSCQVLEEREIPLSKTFCKTCQKPLKEMMLKSEGIYVVKYQDNNRIFYNYDKSKVNVDSLENVLMHKGFLPRKDSIVMHPICCNRKPKKDVRQPAIEEDSLK